LSILVWASSPHQRLPSRAHLFFFVRFRSVFTIFLRSSRTSLIFSSILSPPRYVFLPLIIVHADLVLVTHLFLSPIPHSIQCLLPFLSPIRFLDLFLLFLSYLELILTPRRPSQSSALLADSSSRFVFFALNNFQSGYEPLRRIFYPFCSYCVVSVSPLNLLVFFFHSSIQPPFPHKNSSLSFDGCSFSPPTNPPIVVFFVSLSQPLCSSNRNQILA